MLAVGSKVVVDAAGGEMRERSPDGRYVRLAERLGAGAVKEVWRAYDTGSGREVAWNAVSLNRIGPDARKRIDREVDLLRGLSHRYVLKFHRAWRCEARNQVIFITELVTSGSLRDYILRVGREEVTPEVIAGWCRMTLEGLHYLHTRRPPVIHRDLKCDNLLINGHTGEIRIGDFGLSSVLRQAAPQSVIGTPAFMAPEVFAEEPLTEKVDIYAFGMCVLEMATGRYPYEECESPVRVWRQVSSGIPPAALAGLPKRELREFIELCLLPQERRPSAEDLLRHPLLTGGGGPRLGAEAKAEAAVEAIDILTDPQERLLATTAPASIPAPAPPLADADVRPERERKTALEAEAEAVSSLLPEEAGSTGGASIIECSATAHEREGEAGAVSIVLCLTLSEGACPQRTRKKQVRFDFCPGSDTVVVVSQELATNLGLKAPSAATTLGCVIADALFSGARRQAVQSQV